ncbi:MAG: anaerobic sulfatase maturase [Candidatus Hermodarchaeota archaeon]
MKPFSLLIKPASADCNLRCEYCFYIDHLEMVDKTPRMSDEVLEKMISSYMKTDQNGNYAFGWQGGEPTIMGLDFFKKVVELQKKYGPPGAAVSNGLQTNGILITDEMARFFSEYKFLVGVSLDGPPHLHDYYRKTISRKPTHSLVMRGIENLRKKNVEFNILILINNKTVKKPLEIYQYFKDQGFYYHQYIPCVEYDENSNPLPYSINGEDWGVFLCKLFDEWIKEDIYKVSIRLFDSILEYLIYGRYNVCVMNKNCCQYFVVEYNGNVYPCDFFVREDLLLGNIMTESWEDFLNSPVYNHFGNQKSVWNKACDLCPFLNFCHGDCQKIRVGGNDSSKTLSILCKGWKKFYAHTLPHFETLANKIKVERNIPSTTSIKVKKFGRNDPCPCGSGKKYKSCCMK